MEEQDSDLTGRWSKISPAGFFWPAELIPDNIAEALEYGTYGVDICSGIESEPGKKDYKKMKQLFQTIYNHIGLKAKQ